MMLNERRIALATGLLWSLQESTTAVEGVLLAHIDGLTLTSTMEGDDSMQRLAALSSTMLLLCEKVSGSWGGGDSVSVTIKLKPDASADSALAPVRHIYMHPVGQLAVLVTVCRTDSLPQSFHHYLDRASDYLQAMLEGETPSSRSSTSDPSRFAR